MGKNRSELESLKDKLVQVNRRLDPVEASLRAIDARLERLEKVTDNNAEVHRDVTNMMGAELTVIRLVLEDMIRGDTIMKSLGKIDFDIYLRKYNEQVREELTAREKELSAKASESTEEKPFEFGGDYVKDA